MVQAVLGRRALKHVQVREYVRALISGDAPGSPAPSERELVHLFGVARMTVRQALDALVGEGLLERVPGRGTFVARPRRGANTVLSFTEDMARRGLTASSDTLLLRLEESGRGVSRALGVREGDAVVHWKRIRRADQVPICIEDVYLNELLVPDFVERDTPASLYAELSERGLRPVWVEDTVTADVATREEAAHLEVADETPVLRRQRRGLTDDRVVEVCRSVYRADRYTLRLNLGQPA